MMKQFFRTAIIFFLIAICNGTQAQTATKTADSSAFISLLHRGDSFYAAGRQDSARYYFRKAKDVALRDSLTGYGGFTKLNELGIAYGKMDRLDSAYDFFKRAGEINTQLYGEKKNADLATLSKNIGDYFLLKKIPDSAINRYHHAVTQLVEDFNETDVRMNPVEFRGDLKIRELFTALNAKAKSLTQKFQEDKNKNDLVSSVYTYDAIYRLIAQTAGKSKDTASALIGDKQFAKHQPVENCLLLYNITGDNVFLRHAFRFAERSRVVDKGDDINTNVRKLQSRIPAGHALLSYQSGDTALAAFFVSNNTFKHALVKIDTNFNKDVHAFAEHVKLNKSVSDTNFVALQSQLYNQLIDPLEAEIKGIRNLVIAGAETLSEFPFQALKPAKGAALSASHEITYTQDALVSLWRNRTNEAGGSGDRHLIWLMIGAACLLGAIAGSSVFKFRRHKN